MGAYELAFVGLAGSGVGTLLGLPMVWPRSDRRRDVQLFGLAIVMMSMIAGLISLRLAGLAPSSGTTEHAINLLGMLSLPMLVTYSRYAADQPITTAHAAWWAPAVVYSLIIVTLDVRIPFIAISPVVYSYTIGAAVTLWNHRERRPVVVPAEAVVGFIAVVNVAQLIRMEFADVPVVRALVPIVMTAGFASLAAFATWRVSGASTAARSDAPRYERSTLNEAAARELLEAIETALTRDRLYTRVDLTLGQLAAAVGSSPHQVSEALNRYAGTSFADMLMRRRVDEVKTQLLDPANDRFTIEGIGLSAGFGSRSALYSAFKKAQGMTPTEFRKQRSS